MMNKRILSVGCVLAMLAVMTYIMPMTARAEENKSIIDGSYLTHDKESIGDDTRLEKGEDLLTGYSKVARRGPELLYAGGTTIAAHTVDEVAVSVMVERAQEGDTSWEFYDSWNKYNYNIDKVASSKIMDVEGGYYYRVRCVHSANSDVSSSFTNGVFIEKKIVR